MSSIASEPRCDVCNRELSWGCGHTSEQRRAARRHRATLAHRSGRCWHYSHADCGASCKLRGLRTPGYAPFVRHVDVLLTTTGHSVWIAFGDGKSAPPIRGGRLLGEVEGAPVAEVAAFCTARGYRCEPGWRLVSLPERVHSAAAKPRCPACGSPKLDFDDESGGWVCEGCNHFVACSCSDCQDCRRLG